MPQERLSKIWQYLMGGSRVLGWRLERHGEKHVLIPANGSDSWERSAPDGRWEQVAVAQLAQI